LAAYQRALQGRRRTGERCSRRVAACLGLTYLLLVDRRVRLLRACSLDWAGGRVPMVRGGALRKWTLSENGRQLNLFERVCRAL
jgi:hypothetical protein